MPVSIDNGGAGAPQQQPQQQPPQQQQGGQPPQQHMHQAPKLPGFLATGDAATQAFEEQAQARKAAQEAYGRMWRWYIDAKKDLGKPFRITFLDGIINPNTKLLQNPSWTEHSFKNARGIPEFYVCTDHKGPNAEPCPMCANPNAERPSVVMGFTIIDHRPVTFEKGDKAGKTVPFTRKLFIAKSKTLPLLQMKAQKLQSLRGVSMDVLRTSSMDAAVGNAFELVERYSEEELQATFGADAAPANWDFELNYKTAAELEKLGLGVAVKSVTQGAPSVDYTGNM